jgi:hypothetical protein
LQPAVGRLQAVGICHRLSVPPPPGGTN